MLNRGVKKRDADEPCFSEKSPTHAGSRATVASSADVKPSNMRYGGLGGERLYIPRHREISKGVAASIIKRARSSLR